MKNIFASAAHSAISRRRIKEKGRLHLTAACLTLAGLLLSTVPGTVLAASSRCTVVSSSGKQLVLECNRQTDEFHRGTEVKIKTDNKTRAGER